jgi:hypothetical protein
MARVWIRKGGFLRPLWCWTMDGDNSTGRGKPGWGGRGRFGTRRKVRPERRDGVLVAGSCRPCPIRSVTRSGSSTDQPTLL